MGVDPATIGLPGADAASRTKQDATAEDDDRIAAPDGRRPASDWDTDPGLPELGATPAPEGTAALGSALARPLERTVPEPAARATPGDHDDTNEVRPRARAAPTGARGAVKAFGAGLITVRSAQRMQDEQHLVARVRAPQREHQVVSFVAGKGGVGTSTTAAGVALTLATLRDDRSALLDARAGTDSLGRWLSDPATPEPPARDQMTDESGPYPRERLLDGLDVVDGAPWQSPVTPADMAALTDGFRDSHAFAVIDIGNDVGATARHALVSSTRVVVVTAAERYAARQTRIVLERIGQLRPERLADTVVAVVCRAGWQYKRVLRDLRAGTGLESVVLIPHEPALQTSDHLSLSWLRARTRQAYLQVAAALADPQRVPPALRRVDVGQATR